MVHTLTISKTELARRTRQIVDRARRGEAIIVESYGEEQVAVIDAIDYRILSAVAAYHARSPHPPPFSPPDTEPAGLSEAEVKQAVQKAGAMPQVRWDEVIAAYLDWQINQGRAATLLGLSTYELDERFRRLGIPRRIGPATEQEAQSEVDAALELLS
jgi:transcriptional regulator with GAF, ATPase, and Fis domain